MTTLAKALQRQKTNHILQAPTSSASTQGVESTDSTSTLSIALVNNTSSTTVYAYITGLTGSNNALVYLLQSDGKTVYNPTSPANTQTALAVNCAIPLGAPGTTTTVTVPATAGGRIWYSQNAKLTFLLNPGPALVEPSGKSLSFSPSTSSSNTSDPNYNLYWDFCEFSFSSTSGVYANISYVDFVCIPASLQLTDTSGAVTTVQGLPASGLATVCAGLTAQTAIDGQGWSSLIVKSSTGANLRALSPQNGIVMNNSLFANYFEPYVKQVWTKYSSTALTVDTQSSLYGVVTGTISNNVLSFGSSVGTFAAPTTADIFSGSTGPFANTANAMGPIVARMSAAFQRTTLLIDTVQPDGEVVANYYTNPVTNHYARIVHAAETDGRGYAFSYDDVTPTNGSDVSGFVTSGTPQLLSVLVGRPTSAAATTTTTTFNLRDHATRRGQRPAGRKQRRDLGPLTADEEADDALLVDLEKGQGGGGGKQTLFAATHTAGENDGGNITSSSSYLARPLNSLVPTAWARRGAALLERLERTRIKPVMQLLVLFLDMSVRTLISRVTMAMFLVVFYFIVALVSTGGGGAAAATAAELGMEDAGAGARGVITSVLTAREQ